MSTHHGLKVVMKERQEMLVYNADLIRPIRFSQTPKGYMRIYGMLSRFGSFGVFAYTNYLGPASSGRSIISLENEVRNSNERVQLVEVLHRYDYVMGAVVRMNKIMGRENTRRVDLCKEVVCTH